MGPRVAPLDVAHNYLIGLKAHVGGHTGGEPITALFLTLLTAF